MRETRPRILISAGESQNTAPYVAAVESAGGVALVHRPSEGLAAYVRDDPDAVIFAGGASLAPPLYRAGFEAGVLFDPEDARDEIELALVAELSAIPVLGICRGLQLLNVAAGGTLWQYLPDHGYRDDHWPDVARDAIAHDVRAEGGRLREILGGGSLPVNSIHLQAVRRLAEEYTATVFAADGLIEGIESSDGRVLAVQWHPEELVPTQQPARALFEDLIDRAKGRR